MLIMREGIVMCFILMMANPGDPQRRMDVPLIAAIRAR